LGRLIRMRVPRSCSNGLVAAMCLPMASMKPFAMDGPRPAHLLRSPRLRPDGASSRRNFSNTRSMSACGMRGPSSSIAITTLPRSS
jgi:hypothetical protein